MKEIIESKLKANHWTKTINSIRVLTKKTNNSIDLLRKMPKYSREIGEFHHDHHELFEN